MKIVQSILFYFLSLITLLGTCCCPIFSRPGDEMITINVSRKTGDGETVRNYLSGYRASVSGQTITYHSSHPDAETALLVRANKDAHSIVWETDTLNESSADGFYHFVWLAGIERIGWGNATIPHTFDFSINSERWFTFTNRKDSTASRWTVNGTDGAELSFESHLVDRAGDLFGYMFLKVPQRRFAPGSPLVLEVVGHDAQSLEWYMVFQYRFNFTPHLRVEPALVRDSNEVRQLVRVSLDNLFGNRNIEITSPSGTTITRPLTIGANIFFLPIQVFASAHAMPAVFTIDGKTINRLSVNVLPVRQREMYLVSHTHNDIGYTDLQPNVERRQWHHLEEALRIIRKTRDYSAEARYKWNLEILWPLESYMKQASAEKREEVLGAIRNGGIGLNALFVNPLSGLASAVEMNHFTEYARRFTKEYSIPIVTATVSDVPGFTWGIVTALAQSGVKYFASAPNPFDRIGYVLEKWGDKPFYWTSQSGADKVLMWVAGSSYASFHEGDITRLGAEKIMKLVRRIEEQQYPYDIYYLPYTLGDNGGPDSNLSDFVKRWNEHYVSPKLVIATHQQLFTDFERRYGSTLPTMKGDLTPYWEDGAASTAYETALNRVASNRLIQAGAVWSMRSPKNYPESTSYAAWRNIVLYDEHTWGADKSISDPDDPAVIGQWKIKQRYVLDADSGSQSILSSLVDTPVKKNSKEVAPEIVIDVYNTTSWTRSDLVVLSPEQSSIGDRVVDDTGRPIPSQRLSTGELAVFAVKVPPMAAKRLFIKKGTAYNRGKAQAVGNELQNGLITLSVDTHTGAINNFRWNTQSIELADTGRGFGMNEYFYVRGKNADSAQHVGNVKVSIKEKGPLVVSLSVVADAPGCKRFETEIRLISGIGRVDIINHLDKSAVREKEGVHFGFPFNIPDGQIRYDVAAGIVKLEEDQMAGACKNFLSVQSFVDVSNERYGVTWVSMDAPLVEVGNITAEQPWITSLEPSQTIYSYVMNNYWHTNYKADQEGAITLRYSLLPHVQFKSGGAVHFARECQQPLLAMITDESKLPAEPLFRIDPENLVVESITPIMNGRSWLLYIYNPISEVQRVTLRWKRGVSVKMYASDAFGMPRQGLNDEFNLDGYGTGYVRVDGR